MVKLKPGYQELRKTPAWATYVKRRWPDGRVLNVEGEMWLYRTVPMGPVEDARSPELSAIVGETLRAAFDELATMAGPIKLTRRQTSKGAYRDVHVLLLNVPRLFTPDPDAALAGYHLQQFPHTVVDRRILLVGVRLVPKIDADSLTDTVTNVIETLVAGGDPVENFTKDFREADAALARAALRVPTEEDMRIAESWWNQGDQANVPTLVHPDHLHIFTTVDSARAAALLAHDPDLKCHNWPPMPDGHTVSFATIREFELPFVEGIDHRAHWASKLVQSGAVAISLRGKVEPAPVTRDELRRMRRNYQADIQERYSSGKMDRAEQEETLAALGDVEAFYAAGGTPTLIETSTIVAFTGRDTRAGYDPTEIGRASGVRLSSMVNVQDRAMAEMMIASGIRANPYLRDLPAQSVAYSGLPSLSNVGDNDGALLGFTERDRQPAYLAAMAATDADSIPLALVVGQSGAGKQAGLSTTLPTPVSDRFPEGRTTMGELRVGDRVFGRDGRPCTVTGLSEVDERPELFRVTLSDGQQVLADGNHQWVVSRWWDRNGARHPHRVTAVENWESAQRVVDRLVDLAGELDEGVWLGLDELHTLVEERVAGVFASPQAVYGAMRMTDCEPRLVSRAVTRHNRVTEVVKTDPVVLLPAAEALGAWIGMWEGLSGGNATRWGARAKVRAAAAGILLDEVSSGGVLVELTVPELMRRLRAIDPQVGVLDAGFLRKTAIAAGVGSRRGFAEVHVPLPNSHTSSVKALEYPARQAVFGLALRLSQQAGEQPALEPGEQVLSTNEILGAGLRTSKGQAVFAIRLPKPIEGPEAELSVALYTFGAWLGDGTSNSGSIASMDDEIVDLIEADGYPLRSIWQDRSGSAGRASSFSFEGLFAALRTVLEFDLNVSYRKLDKRIPAAYLRASRAQRLALLQGLMDTDGTISRSGGCEISLSKPDLAADVLELVRSLGIKASMTVGSAGYRDAEGNQVVCRPRHRIKFTTTLEVFRLARKRALLPVQVRRTQEWLYITSIDPVLPGEPGYEPARCISVDSPDHTYLLAGFVPTHNSVLMSWLGDQFARIPNARGERTPVVIFDPKALALDTKVWTPTGHTTVGEVGVGDMTIGGDGRPCRVIAKSPVFPAGETQMYEAAFDDGQKVRADCRHRWLVLTSRQRAAAAGADERQIAERLRTRRSDSALLGELAASAGHEDVTTGELFGELCAAGIGTWGNPKSLARDLRFFGAKPTCRKGRGRKHVVWDRREAMGAAAERASRLVDHPFGEVLTTGELVSRGLSTVRGGGGLEFAIEVPGPTQSPEVRVSRRDGYHYIQSIAPSAPEPAQCLTVDSPDHTFVIADGIRTHNTHSDFSGVVRLSGGTTYSLDELSTADGVFDPLRFSHVPAVGIEGAHATLMAVNPWGTVEERARWETPLLKALNYGVAQGARSTMRALVVAERDGVAARALVDPVRDVMEASPMFSALCGTDDNGQALRAAEGITYIKVGNNSLNLPAPGTAAEDLSIPQKVTLQLVRNIVYGAMSALSGRQGVIMLDEAWVFTSAGRTEMERVGRLARSQQVFPMLFTQRVTDALNADLAGYISRGVILPITDVNEAVAACELFNLEPTPERMARITARQSMGDAGDDSGAPNWRSMRALRDPVTRQVLRGTIGIYADISGRAVPTEIRIPPGFLAAASTNRLDMQDRAREAARAAEADQTAAQEEAQVGAFAPAEPEPDEVQPLRGMESGW